MRSVEEQRAGLMIVARRLGDYFFEQTPLTLVLRRIGFRYLVEFPWNGYDVYETEDDGSHGEAVAFNASAEVAAHYLCQEDD